MVGLVVATMAYLIVARRYFSSLRRPSTGRKMGVGSVWAGTALCTSAGYVLGIARSSAQIASRIRPSLLAYCVANACCMLGLPMALLSGVGCDVDLDPD